MHNGISSICWWMAALVAGLPAPLSGAEIQLPEGPMAALASPSFQDREKAQADLVEWARGNQSVSLGMLLEKSRTAGDPEVRARCLNALKVLVNEEYERDGEGFIGIAMLDEAVVLPGENQLRGAVRVSLVQDGSAGEVAGLRLRDQIVGVNGEQLPVEDVSRFLTNKVRMLKPGTRIQLAILRDDNPVKVEVKLGRRPIMADSVPLNAPDFDREAAEQIARETYFKNWLNQRKAAK